MDSDADDATKICGRAGVVWEDLLQALRAEMPHGDLAEDGAEVRGTRPATL